jgi:hypothetical protein
MACTGRDWLLRKTAPVARPLCGSVARPAGVRASGFRGTYWSNIYEARSFGNCATDRPGGRTCPSDMTSSKRAAGSDERRVVLRGPRPHLLIDAGTSRRAE